MTQPAVACSPKSLFLCIDGRSDASMYSPAACVHRAGLLDTALAAACVSLQAYTRALGVSYVLPKLDLVRDMLWLLQHVSVSSAALCVVHTAAAIRASKTVKMRL
jgi:hypothetical protein